MLYVTMDEDGLVVEDVDKKDERLPLRVRNAIDFDMFLDIWKEYGTLQSSSGLDWPEDETDDPDIILMCDLVRGNNVSGRNPEFKYGIPMGDV